MLLLCKTKIWWKIKDTDNFIVYIKTNYIYRDIADVAETKFDTSKYELDRPLRKGKNKKVIGLSKMS